MTTQKPLDIRMMNTHLYQRMMAAIAEWLRPGELYAEDLEALLQALSMLHMADDCERCDITHWPHTYVNETSQASYTCHKCGRTWKCSWGIA